MRASGGGGRSRCQGGKRVMAVGVEVVGDVANGRVGGVEVDVGDVLNARAGGGGG